MNELEMQDEEFWRQLEWLSLQFISSEIEIKINESESTGITERLTFLLNSLISF